ncbi:MAG: hypothetical protein APR54_10670 [Candidatus Cloacimonas sp. SDB]|nr:MAG: hypothetical protein APR54_10670 [Candidatus Cloacimonas sp. SDB]
MENKGLDQVIFAINRFPRKLSTAEGKFLKRSFELILDKTVKDIDAKSLRYYYKKEVKGITYLLAEEYLFRDRETHLDINHAITVNYYLNKIADSI